MYLTRFRINTGRVGARKLLASPQTMHAAVMTSFAEPPAPGGNGPRVLWRLDADGNSATHLCIVSPLRPDLTHLVEQAGWPTTARWDTFDYTPFLQRLTPGDTWSFRLTANPVHSIRRNPGEPTKVTAHIGPAHQLGWLLKQQEKGGFRVSEKPPGKQLIPGHDTHDLLIHGRRQLRFAKKGNKDQVTVVAVTFDGRLHVTDPGAFRATLTRGLGRAKAYGCGLMTLAKD
ncbi:type I-E CRISPR-associated protein Cas6/Cse3/CasE [Actinomadura graeca]|uniref:Type I-E CRISPR-associated protein Cas6/Cse3/CasE n=1 Tax=Actinomadura graeca TaxID=2750812 RepID=A0ABX8R5G9_9ACTN|nr:type I-E CRISPR-associated protein Cas6/Cse3/CasE [Actinomadura graeca]QXJ24233.1 type I-E CRISPR-associated protein Cas6/Cse3/CasE [Actinomadura graeca]